MIMNHSEEFVSQRLEAQGYKLEGILRSYNTPNILKVLPIQEWAKCFPINYRIQTFDFSVFYDPEADFDYYTCCAGTHDGTLLFEYDIIAKCYSKIFGETYFKPKCVLKDGKKAKINFTLGDIVIENIYHEHGKNNPWPEMTTIAYLPIKYDWNYVRG